MKRLMLIALMVLLVGAVEVTAYAVDITTDSAGNVYVTRTTSGVAVTTKYSSSGEIVWAEEYPGAYGWAIAVDGDGYVYVGGKTSRTGHGYRVLKYNSGGGSPAVYTHDNLGPYYVEFVDIAAYGGTYYATGWVQFPSGEGGGEAVTVIGGGSIDRFCPGASVDNVCGIGVSSGGNVYVGGSYYTGSTDRHDFFVKQIGDIFGTKGEGQYGTAEAMVVDSAGNVYITGYTADEDANGNVVNYRCVVLKFEGTQLDWIRTYSGVTGNGVVMGNAIAVDSAGNVYVTGADLNYGCITIKYDKNGYNKDGGEGELWVSTYEGGIGDSIAVDCAGNVYAGMSNIGKVLKYDSSGALVGTEDFPAEVMVADYSGNVFAASADGSVIKLGGINHPPVLVPIGTKTIEGAGLTIEFYVTATDADGDPLTYSATNLPTGATFETTTRRFIWTPTDDQLGKNYTITVSVTDGQAIDTEVVKIVSPPAPVVEPVWEKVIEAPGTDRINKIATDGQRNVYAVGTLNDDFYTIKYNSAGIKQWDAIYNGPGNGVDEAMDVAIDSNDNVYVTGRSDGGPGYRMDWVTIKYSSGGAQQWRKRYYPSSTDDVASSIAVDNAGHVYVTGTALGTVSQTFDIVTKQYNASDGSETGCWTKVYDGGNATDNAYKVIYGAGKVYVLGLAGGGATGNDIVTIAYDAVSGIQLWSDRYNGTANGNDWPRDLVLGGSDNVYVTGGTYNTGTDCDITTIKYYASGSRAWVAKYDGPDRGFDMGRAVAVDSDYNVYVTGFIYTGWANGNDYILIKYDGTGAKQWVATYNGLGSSDDQARSIKLDDGGNVYISGRSMGIVTGFDCATLKYASNGNLQWLGRYNGAGNALDSGEAMAFDAQGFLYVAGVATGGDGSFDCLVMKYNTNGPPVFTPHLANQTVLEGDTLVYTVTGRDWDIPAQILSLTASNLPAGVTFLNSAELDPSDPRYSTSTNPITGYLTYSPGGYDAVAHPDTQLDLPAVTFTLSDGKAPGVSSSIIISVIDVNRDPVMDDLGMASVNEGSTLEHFVTATDPDGDEMLSMTYSMDTTDPETPLPNGLTIETIDTPTGKIGKITWIPAEDQAPWADIIYVTAWDGYGGSVTKSLMLEAREDNTPPELTLNPPGNQIVDEGVNLTIQLSATDADLPAQTLTYSVEGLPSETLNKDTGEFTWTPGEAQGPGTYDVTFKVTDSLPGWEGIVPSMEDSETITITVNEVNTAPVLQGIPNQEVYVGDQVFIELHGSDSDLPAQTLTYSAEGLPPGLSVSTYPLQGVIMGTPTAGGSYAVTARVSDGALTAEKSFTLTVYSMAPGPNEDVPAGEDTYISGDSTAPVIITAEPAPPEYSNVVLEDMVLETVKAITLEADHPEYVTGPVTIRMLIATGDVTPGLEASVAMYKYLDGAWREAVAPYGTGGTIFLGTVDGSYKYEATFSGFCQIAVAYKPLTAQVSVVPRTMNLRSKGVFTVFINVPANIPLSEIVTTSVQANGISPTSVKLDEASHRVMAKFERQGFNFGDGTIKVRVKRIHSGTEQYMLGQDTITLIQ